MQSINLISIRTRNNAGSAILEVAGVGFIVVIMALISVNLGVLVFAAWLNDSACRDACRAAAQQCSEDDAKGAAIIAAKQYATTAGGIVGDPKVMLDAPYFEFQRWLDDEGKPQINKGPFVKISTSLVAKLPVPMIYNGVGFSDFLTFNQTYTFPLLQPATDDNGDEGIDPAMAQQEEDDLLKQDALAAAESQDVNIPLPTTTPDPSSLPNGIDPNNLPNGIDPNNLPAGIDPNSLPASIDPNSLPGN